MAPRNEGSNSVLAGSFALCLLLMGLVPYTLYVLLSGKQSSDTRKGKVRPFDPFEILGVSASATEKEIKRAYRQLSLKFHPDKNPDPKSVNYFAEFISPAYKALTDETARTNLAKYGHPDGPQGMSVGVALPAFLFEKGRLAPLVLFAIVAVGILAPLGAVVVYITNADEYTPNKVLQSTVAVFTSATEHKNSLSPTRVLPLLLTAHEYQALPVRRAEEEALARLAAELRGEVVDPKDPKFGAMHPATRKALVLLAAHLGRAAVPPELRDDLGAVVALVPRLVEELLRLAQRPRPPQGYAWLRPLLSLLEFSQCFAQAVPVGGRVEGGKAGSAAQGEALLSLLQLPGVDAAAAKKLAKARLRCLADLVLLGPQERDAALASLGLATDALAALGAALDGAPCVTLAALCETVGEEGGEVLEGDLVTCSVRVRLERPRAAAPPRLPLHDKDEGWWVIVGDVASNALFAAHKVALVTHVGLERFAQAARSPPPAAPTVDGVAGAGGDDSAGQLVTLRFKAPPAGVHQAQVMVVCDAWVGVDRRVPLKLRVAKPRATDKPQPQAAPADATAPGDASSDEAEGDAAADLTESGTSESDG